MSMWVRGPCPACGGRKTLFVGEGGYLTCSWWRCPDPSAAHRWLATARLDRSSVERADKLERALVDGPDGFDCGGIAA